eukprot:TRINITY_DN27737_c0_g2_i1.p1 TRINITY_DN27737_c0_g2~~TRINITY_DN27737_c0_g2_i1.p1  ORF type:complete len:270 (+),score=106.94 TRINITY_DN27737_c0_g2_i1:87-812(+)
MAARGLVRALRLGACGAAAGYWASAAAPVRADNAQWHMHKLAELSGQGPLKVGRMADPTIDHVLLTEAQIARKVTELAGRMAGDYHALGAQRVTLICVLKGSIVFTADLMRALSHAGLESEVEFLSVSSYGNRRSSSGTVRLELDCRQDVKDKHVLIVEDICESGNTLIKLIQMFQQREPASLRTVVLLNKGSKRSARFEELGLKVDYTGFEIPDKFVGGYGLDFAERFRELGDIVALKPS